MTRSDKATAGDTSPTSATPATATIPHDEVIPILDFGGQTVELIARRVREAGCFSILVAPNITPTELAKLKPKGIILSGGPASVYDQEPRRATQGSL